MSSSLEVKINPAVLVWARKTANYEIEEISHKMNLNSDRMKCWEKGKERPTYTQLLDLAEHYQRPAMLFFSPEVPKYESNMPDFRTLPNSNNKKISPEVSFELRSAKARRENLISLEELDDYEIPKFRLNTEINEENKNAKSLAEDIRKSLGVSWAKQTTLTSSDKALEFWISKVESLGVLIFQFYSIEPKEMRGYAISHEKLPIIGINVKEHAHGKIFTLFHELAHIAIKKEGISNFSSFKLKDNVEIFCNQVAAEILVPENFLLDTIIVKEIMPNVNLNEDHLQQLSRKFKVSPEVIIRRLISIDKLSNTFLKKEGINWNKYIANNYKRKTERHKPKNVKNKVKNKIETNKNPHVSKALKRNGFYYTELVLEAYNNDLITSSDVSEYLGEKLQTIEEIRNRISKRGLEK